jgi:hypothetical protein
MALQSYASMAPQREQATIWLVVIRVGLEKNWGSTHFLKVIGTRSINWAA